MTKLSKSDLLPYEQYKNMYPKFLNEVIEEKKKRRVTINDKMTGLFESKLTVFYQIQEMIRAEQITDGDYINEMLDVYNDLLPDKNELSMTLFIEIPDQEELRKFNKTIVGIEKHVQIVFGDNVVTSYEPDNEDEDDEHYTQSVHYLHFPFDDSSKNDFLSDNGKIFLRINHQNYKSETVLPAVTVNELKKQLMAE